MSLQKNFDVFIIGELEIRQFDFFFFPLKNFVELSLGLQLELVAFLGLLPCCRPPCSLPFSSQFFSSFFWCVCHLPILLIKGTCPILKCARWREKENCGISVKTPMLNCLYKTYENRLVRKLEAILKQRRNFELI